MRESKPGRLELPQALDQEALDLALHGGKLASRAENPAFDALRQNAYQQMLQDIIDRLAVDPVPTHQERLMGTYVEALEPQVRSATLIMRGKGYDTLSSGFDVRDRGLQAMDFRSPRALDGSTAQQLLELGAEIQTPRYPGFESTLTRISFTPAFPDLTQIETQWNAIAAVLPDTGVPTFQGVETTRFGIYCPEDINWPIDQLRVAAAGS